MKKAGISMKKRRTNILIGTVCVIIIALAVTLSPLLNKGKNSRYNILGYLGGNGAVTYRFPAEFEPQQAIWFQWPSEAYTTGDRNVVPSIIKIIKAAAASERVNLITRNTSEIMKVKKLLSSNGYKGSNVHYYNINHLSIWTRDVGPIFIKDNKDRLNVVNFGFNNYSRDGSEYYVNTEGQVDKLTAKVLKLNVVNSKLISEGGAIESNGKGTLMLTESVALKRNPGMTKLQIENEYKRVLGVKKVIWLKKGLAEDDAITSGHINEFARFSDPNTILLAQVLPVDRYANWASKESYLRLEENYNILKNSTDQNGKHFKIIRIPIPPTLYREAEKTGVVAVRSYLNYAVINRAVIIPSYWRSGRSDTLKTVENQVKTTFGKVFPGRKVISVDSENINKWGGGIHCISQHMPAY